jgi:succinate dehydrogenase/fumarate reductase flavoprotein subunit
VVGFGFAGAAAALTAHEHGASVLIVEKMPEPTAGGDSRVSGNVWFNPTSVQLASVYLRSLCGDYPIPDAIVAAWSRETARNTEWIESFGAKTGLRAARPEFPELLGHECDDGPHYIEPGWGMSRLYELLKAAVMQRGIEVLYSTPALELLQDDCAVVGVRASSREAPLLIEAERGVVLASGGFANNQDMVREFLHLPSGHPSGTPAATGDGIKMAQKAGADIWHMGNFMGRLGLKAPEFASGFDVKFAAGGWILVRNDGKRFVNETQPSRHGKALIGGQLEPHPAVAMHAIFDEKTRLAGPLSDSVASSPYGWTRLVERYEWSSDNRVEIEKGWILKANTLRELAENLALEPDALAQTVQTYNANCERGTDYQFGRDPTTLVPVSQPPFYGFTWGPLIVYTCGGPRKDEFARVLDPFGRPIAGLYCAGEISSTYSFCMSGGQMIGDALAFGRIAGRSASSMRRRLAHSRAGAADQTA